MSTEWSHFVRIIQFFQNLQNIKKVQNSPVSNLSKYAFAAAQIEMVPQNYQKLESKDHIKLMEKLIEIMDDDDDVQNIWHNWEE